MSGLNTPLRARRDLLRFATLGTGLAGIGLAAKGLFGAMATTEDVSVIAHPTEFDLSTLPEGEVAVLDISDRFVVQILHRSATLIAQAAAVLPDQLYDRNARNPNLPVDSLALASDDNRRATPDGRFVAVVGVCPHEGCRLIGNAGEFSGWFCPCCSTHFDSAGRCRKGLGLPNLAVPAMTFVSPAKLMIYQNPRMKLQI